MVLDGVYPIKKCVTFKHYKILEKNAKRMFLRMICKYRPLMNSRMQVTERSLRFHDIRSAKLK